VKLASKRSKGYEVSFSFQCYFIFAIGVKNRTVICKNIFRCLVKMMKMMRLMKKVFSKNDEKVF